MMMKTNRHHESRRRIPGAWPLICATLVFTAGCDGHPLPGHEHPDCGVPVEPPAPETACDGKDDDMDGRIDEDFDIDGDGAVRCCDPGAFFATYAQGTGPSVTHVDAYVHDAGGSFNRVPEIAGGLIGQGMGMNAMADFDNDGTDELLWHGNTTFERYATSCQARAGATQGEWVTEAWGGWFLNDGAYGAGGLVNDDECVDLVGWKETRDPNSNTIISLEGYTALGNCDGTFTEIPGTFLITVVAGEWLARYNYNIKDIDGDGFVDFVMQSYATGGASSTRPYYLPGQGTGYFDPPVPLAVALNQPQNSGDVLDIDGDAHVELIGGSDDDGDKGLVLLWDDLLAGVTPVSLVDSCVTCPGSGAGHGSGSSRLYDWNGDGFPDLLTSHVVDTGISAQIEYWDNRGGSFSGTGTLVVSPAQLQSGWLVPPLTVP